MKLKISPRHKLNDRVWRRFYTMVIGSIVAFGFNYFTQVTTDNVLEQMFVEAQDGDILTLDGQVLNLAEGEEDTEIDSKKFEYNEKEWEHQSFEYHKNGYIYEVYNEQQCTSGILLPGMPLFNRNTMGLVYFIILCYLFLGIAIVADIFMEAIEVITSQTRVVEIIEPSTGKRRNIDVPVWNATLANLTLMALGSSAPEIFLSVLETVTTLGEPAGELGPSTIVGSAAFNLLMISAASVVAVGEKPKKILDLGVFFTTAIFSIFAYIWLYACLSDLTGSENQIRSGEAGLTLFYFILLCTLAFAADKFNAYILKKRQTQEELEEEQRQQEIKVRKNTLRQYSGKYSELVVIEIAQGTLSANIEQDVPEPVKKEIVEYFQFILGDQPVEKASISQLHDLLQPESLFERFAARKANGIANTKDFLAIKGTKGQIEDHSAGQVVDKNELIRFKCLGYSVAESSGQVEIVIQKGEKANQQEITVGIRTVDGTAQANVNYTPIDDIMTMKTRQEELVIPVPIIDNQEWQPDLDFTVELYDPNDDGQPTHAGDDTTCKVTILDEDFPGSLGFEMTDMRVSRQQKKVDITVVRSDGSDGKISCSIKTGMFSEDNTSLNAGEYDDYVPKHEVLTFEHGEQKKTVSIEIVSTKLLLDDAGKTDKEEQEQDTDENIDLMFLVRLEKHEPENIKISKKNACIVTIVDDKQELEMINNQEKLKIYYLQSQDVTWGRQFMNAVMLQPQIDDDNLMDDVTLGESINHFLTINWKVLFAIIPPSKMGGGWPAFIIALSLIGAVTYVVGEIASVLGCSLGLKDSVTAITLVAMGTSLPDTFASMTAATSSEYADSAVGNITGSNSVNVFLGLGLPWVIASWYNESNGNFYEVPQGALAFSVFLFLVTSILCFIILIIRRIIIGGELGGPQGSKYLSALCLISLWVVYIVFSILKAYNIIGDAPEE